VKSLECPAGGLLGVGIGFADRLDDLVDTAEIPIGEGLGDGIARQEGRQDTTNRCQLDKSVEVEHRRRIRSGHCQVVVRHQKKVQRMITGACADIDNDDIGLQLPEMANQPLFLA